MAPLPDWYPIVSFLFFMVAWALLDHHLRGSPGNTKDFLFAPGSDVPSRDVWGEFAMYGHGSFEPPLEVAHRLILGQDRNGYPEYALKWRYFFGAFVGSWVGTLLVDIAVFLVALCIQYVEATFDLIF